MFEVIVMTLLTTQMHKSITDSLFCFVAEPACLSISLFCIKAFACIERLTNCCLRDSFSQRCCSTGSINPIKQRDKSVRYKITACYNDNGTATDVGGDDVDDDD